MRPANLVNFANPGAPKGLIRDARAWVDERNRRQPQLRAPQPEAWWWREVFPEGETLRPMRHPYTPTPFDEFDAVRWTHEPAATLYYLRGCRILGAEGAVIAPGNRVFAEFTMPPGRRWLEHACFLRRRIPPVRPLAGWHATLAWPQGHFFFHWMLECLPRMAVLGERAQALDGLFVPGPLQPFQRESLEMLGVPAHKLRALDAEVHVAPEHLFVPRAFALYNPPSWLPDWFRRSFLSAEAVARTGPRRIYVSRGDAPARRLENEEEIVARLAPHGFEAVTMTGLHVREQARLFAGADLIVAPHGGALANLVFCRPGTRVLEIMPPRWMSPCYMSLAATAQLDWRHVVAQEPGSPGGDPQVNALVLPLSALDAALREFLP